MFTCPFTTRTTFTTTITTAMCASRTLRESGSVAGSVTGAGVVAGLTGTGVTSTCVIHVGTRRAGMSRITATMRRLRVIMARIMLHRLLRRTTGIAMLAQGSTRIRLLRRRRHMATLIRLLRRRPTVGKGACRIGAMKTAVKGVLLLRRYGTNRETARQMRLRIPFPVANRGLNPVLSRCLGLSSKKKLLECPILGTIPAMIAIPGLNAVHRAAGSAVAESSSAAKILERVLYKLATSVTA